MSNCVLKWTESTLNIHCKFKLFSIFHKRKYFIIQKYKIFGVLFIKTFYFNEYYIPLKFGTTFWQDGCRICSLCSPAQPCDDFKQYLNMFQRNPDKFLHRFITVDETSIISYPRRRNSQNNEHHWMN